MKALLENKNLKTLITIINSQGEKETLINDYF